MNFPGLSLDRDEQSDEDLPSFNSKLLQDNSTAKPELAFTPIIPHPGFCVKFQTTEGDKVFVNVCHHDAVPPPQEISEKELQAMMNSDVINLMMPVSISEAHYEGDHSLNPCPVYDIATNSKFFREKLTESELFKEFFLTVILSSLDQKFNIKCDPDVQCKIMKKMKQKGQLLVHRIQNRDRKKLPNELIEEIDKPCSSNLIVETPSSSTITSKSLDTGNSHHKPITRNVKSISEISTVMKSEQNQKTSRYNTEDMFFNRHTHSQSSHPRIEELFSNNVKLNHNEVFGNGVQSPPDKTVNCSGSIQEIPSSSNDSTNIHMREQASPRRMKPNEDIKSSRSLIEDISNISDVPKESCVDAEDNTQKVRRGEVIKSSPQAGNILSDAKRSLARIDCSKHAAGDAPPQHHVVRMSNLLTTNELFKLYFSLHELVFDFALKTTVTRFEDLSIVTEKRKLTVRELNNTKNWELILPVEIDLTNVETAFADESGFLTLRLPLENPNHLPDFLSNIPGIPSDDTSCDDSRTLVSSVQLIQSDEVVFYEFSLSIKAESKKDLGVSFLEPNKLVIRFKSFDPFFSLAIPYNVNIKNSNAFYIPLHNKLIARFHVANSLSSGNEVIK